MKNKVLAIFKYHRAWNMDVVNSFSNFYDIEYLQISDYKNKNFTEIINDINNVIKSKSVEIVIFDVDYFKFINLFFIEKINSKNKILITADDFDFHEMHSVTVSSCDLVLSACPLSVLKYKEKGYEAYYLSFDNGKINKKKNKKKEIDVLFFGHVTPDRKGILEYIVKEGISLKNIGHETGIYGSEEELLDLISKSKIVLNLSKTRTTVVQNYASESIYQFYYQLKGRIFLAGLNGAACVSEYSPGQELVFNVYEVPTFFTKEECTMILKKLLNNNELLEKYTNKLPQKYAIYTRKKRVLNPFITQ